jgi:hypothetical protein
MTPRRLLQIQYAASANSPLPRTTTSARRSTTGRPQDVVAVVSAVAVPRTVHACMVCVRRQQPGTRSSIFACVYVLIYTARRRSMVTDLRQGRSKKKKCRVNASPVLDKIMYMSYVIMRAIPINIIFGFLALGVAMWRVNTDKLLITLPHWITSMWPVISNKQFCGTKQNLISTSPQRY